MQIAVASSDGERVDEHFGKADRFWFFDIDGISRSLIMVRSVQPLSTGDKHHPFDPDRMHALKEVLRGCERVYCTRIGERPRHELEQAGIIPVVYSGSISSIMI